MRSEDDEVLLNRLQAGDLDAEAEAALFARMARDPALQAAWALRQTRSDPDGTDPTWAPPAARTGGRALPWAAATMALVAAAAIAAWPRPPPELTVLEGSHRIAGRASVRAGEVTARVRGQVVVTVAPPGGATPAVTIAVQEGTATVRNGRGAARRLAAGDTARIGAPLVVPEAEDPLVAARARIEDLETQNQLLQQMLVHLEVELRGTPVPWSDELPDVLRPAGFERTVREALATCAPTLELVGFECSEPPCLALLRAGDDRWFEALVDDCPIWRERYGATAFGTAGQATCADGTTESYQVLGWSDRLVEPPGGYPHEERENRDKRLATRVDEIERSWRCAR